MKIFYKDINIFESNGFINGDTETVNDVIVLAYVYNMDETKIKTFPDDKIYELNGERAMDVLVKEYGREELRNSFFDVKWGLGEPKITDDEFSISLIKLKELLESEKKDIIYKNKEQLKILQGKRRKSEKRKAKIDKFSEDTRNF